MDTNLVKEEEKITDLKQHLLNRVKELQKILDDGLCSEKTMITQTIETNIEIYESNYGEFPEKDKYGIKENVTKDVNIKDFYENK